MAENESIRNHISVLYGTQRLYDLIQLFYEHKGNSVIFINEIDRSLHTNLIRRFVELFYKLTEEDTSQIIAATHDSNLLDLELVRQDEIWFIKRLSDHSSSIYSLNCYKERYDKKIDKEYFLGRYDAIPIFDEEILEDIYAEERVPAWPGIATWEAQERP